MSLHRAPLRYVLPAGVAITVAVCALGAASDTARAADYVPNEVVVQYAPATTARTRIVMARLAGADDPAPVAPQMRVLRLSRGVSVAQAIARLRHRHDVEWAVPDFVAHAAAATRPPATTPPTAAPPAPLPPPFLPNDPGSANTAGGWAQLQWNFAGRFGVDAPQAWGNLIADGAPGGRGVVVAVLDTGIAYRNWGRFRRSPDFTSSQFVKGYDFVDPGAYPVDHNGHGTHVAGTIAEATDNGYGLTGLAYGVRLMPVRVLNTFGEGDAAVIAKGVRYAVNHHAQVINLSLEFDAGVSASDIPELISALRYAHHKGVLVVAAAGNEGTRTVAYPAKAPYVVSVGATTEHGCLSDFSNDGRGLTLVAPGGGPDADLPGDPDCRPAEPSGHDIYQVTFLGASPRHFGIPSGYDGTSMAAPHVSAVAALIIASHVLGSHPTPAAIVARLKATTTRLGDPEDRSRYGAGLVNAAAATAPGGPGAVAPPPPAGTTGPSGTT